MPGTQPDQLSVIGSIQSIEAGNYLGEIYQPPINRDERLLLATRGSSAQPFAEKNIKVGGIPSTVRMFRFDNFGGLVSIGENSDRLEHFRQFVSENAALLYQTRRLNVTLGANNLDDWIGFFVEHEKASYKKIKTLKELHENAASLKPKKAKKAHD
jgi:hypothetical protein